MNIHKILIQSKTRPDLASLNAAIHCGTRVAMHFAKKAGCKDAKQAFKSVASLKRWGNKQ